MADAAIGATIQVVLETVLSLANDRIGQVLGFKEELQRLSKTVKLIQGFVADVDDKKHNPGVLDWVKDLEEEVFKAENVLDEVKYENLRLEVKYRSQLRRNVWFFFAFFSTIGFRSRMASKIRGINTNLEKINQVANAVGLVTRYHIEAANFAVPTTATRPQTDSLVVSKAVLGREDDESEIVEMLLSPSDKVVSVIPIYGMPGMGKTTLAKKVYNNLKINAHFDEESEEGEKGKKSKKSKKVWVCVAKPIKIEDLFKLILGSLRKERVKLDIRESIVQEIKKELEGKRCFLVLDDVWNEEEWLWDDFFNTLEGLRPANGSWCLVTTRWERVANAMSRHMRKDRPKKLKRLTHDDCWSIIKGRVTAAEEIPDEMRWLILKRCDGVPLAATLFGALLAKGKEECSSIVQRSLLDGHDFVKEVIKVSFDHLSPESVKKCFAYCSVFPRDTGMEKDLLIELWMAEGFLPPYLTKNERLIEDTGDDYIKILLQSSLLEKVNEWGTTRYKMHDLVHDFAKSVLNQVRILELSSFEDMVKAIKEKNTASFRTLFLRSSITGDVLSKFKCLYVLKLSGEDVKVLPDSIDKLIHLRLLDISDSAITILPESLRKLYNLQTLRIKDGKLEEGLPKQMSNLINLRHLHYYDTHPEFQMPSKMGRLICLQTLEFFNVGQEDGRGIEELGNLKDLKGSLEIRNLELVHGKEGAEGAKLFGKPNLSKLIFSWSNGDRESDNCDEHVLEGLQPHPNLQHLQIRNFMGDHFPGWFINLSTLVSLVFGNCETCYELPALGQLPSLVGLGLNGLKNMRSIGYSFYGISSGGGEVKECFPRLKNLYLKDMENLEEWKDEDEVRLTTGAIEVNLFPVLKRLSIERCSQLISAPRHFPSIEQIIISDNCPIWLLKRNVSNITTLSSLELLGFTSLQRLNISKCNGFTSLPGEMLEPCASLKELKITYCNGLISLPGEMLKSCASLRILRVHDCPNLVYFPHNLRQTASLEILNLSDCPKLMIADMPKGFAFLTSLRTLFIGPFSINETNEEFDWSALTTSSPLFTLTFLGFFGLPHVESLPEQLQYFTSLTELNLRDFGIEALPDWIGNLASLERLVLRYCKKLLKLPSMAVRRRLTKLTYVQIVDCPLLEERCKSSTNSKWPIRLG